jgi:hypothetical protein
MACMRLIAPSRVVTCKADATRSHLW